MPALQRITWISTFKRLLSPSGTFDLAQMVSTVFYEDSELLAIFAKYPNLAHVEFVDG